jgi:hypothetical protein
MTGNAAVVVVAGSVVVGSVDVVVDDGFFVDELPASDEADAGTDVDSIGPFGGASSAPGCGFPAQAATSEAATKQDKRHRRGDTQRH